MKWVLVVIVTASIAFVGCDPTVYPQASVTFDSVTYSAYIPVITAEYQYAIKDPAHIDTTQHDTIMMGFSSSNAVCHTLVSGDVEGQLISFNEQPMASPGYFHDTNVYAFDADH